MIGQDRPGLVDILAKQIYAHQGNWLASNFARMAGQFAGFVEVHVPENQHDTLIASLNALDSLHVQSVSTAQEEKHSANSLVIEVMGNDKPGIVQEITTVLHQFEVNIVSMESRCESAPNWGSLMFKANVIVEVPETIDSEDIIEALENVANDLVVDISTYN